MGELRWYKRDPDAALNGMMQLTLDERGAYNTVLDLIYSRDGNLPDDDRFIAGWLRVDVRVWRRIKTRLIDCQKIYIEDGLLRNERADVEILRGLSRVASARDAGLASGNSRAAKSGGRSNKISNLARTGVATKSERTLELPTTRVREEEEEGASAPSAREPVPVEKSPKPRNPKAKPESGLPWHGIPDEIPLDAWHRFLSMRRDKRKPVTSDGAGLLINKLRELAKDGHPPGKVLDQSTLHGWTGLFAIDKPRNSTNGQFAHSARETTRETGERLAAELRSASAAS